MFHKLNIPKTVLISGLIITFVVAVYLRYYFWINPGYVGDIKNFFWPWGQTIFKDGFWALYKQGYYPGVDYPPLIPLLTSWLMHASVFIWGKLDFDSFIYFFKILPTFLEIIFLSISIILVYRSKISYTYWLIGFIILQPGLAFVSTAWGQVDAVLMCFIFLAFVFLDKKKYTISSGFLFLALLTKPQAILACAIYFFILLLNREYRQLVFQTLILLFLVGGMAILFWYNTGANFFAPYLGAIGRYTTLSSYAFNFWWAVFHNKCEVIADTDIIGFLSYRSWGLVLFVLSQIPLFLYFLKSERKLPHVLLGISYVYLMFFLFSSQMHERYLYYSVALLAVPAVLNKKIFGLYIILSITLFINCFALVDAAYHSFNFFKEDPIPQWWTQWIAIINVTIGVGVIIYLLMTARTSKNLTVNKLKPGKSQIPTNKEVP